MQNLHALAERRSATGGADPEVFLISHTRPLGLPKLPTHADQRLAVVVWANQSQPLPELLAQLPAQTAVVLTGNAWAEQAFVAGDLRAFAAEFSLRWIVEEPDPRRAIVGLVQQLEPTQTLVVIAPAPDLGSTMTAWVERGRQLRGELEPWEDSV